MCQLIVVSGLLAQFKENWNMYPRVVGSSPVRDWLYISNKKLQCSNMNIVYIRASYSMRGRKRLRVLSMVLSCRRISSKKLIFIQQLYWPIVSKYKWLASAWSITTCHSVFLCIILDQDQDSPFFCHPWWNFPFPGIWKSTFEVF